MLAGVAVAEMLACILISSILKVRTKRNDTDKRGEALHWIAFYDAMIGVR